MSAIIRYSAAVEPVEADNLWGAINSIAATIAATAEMAEAIVDSSDLRAGNIAHGIAELLHLQNQLLCSLAVLAPSEKVP